MDKDLDTTYHVVPYEVVSLAMRAPRGHDLWFELKVDGMDGYSELVRLVNLGRPEASTNGLQRHMKFTFVASDKAGNVYSVEAHETLPGFHGEEAFKPYMTIDRSSADAPKSRTSYDSARFSGAAAGSR